MKYILTYYVNEWPEMGGGELSQKFATAEAMHKRAEDLLLQNNGKDKPLFTYVTGYKIESVFDYEPASVVTTYKPVETRAWT